MTSIATARIGPRAAGFPVGSAQAAAGLTATLFYVFGPVSLYLAAARTYGGDEIAASGLAVAFATAAAGTFLLSWWYRQPLALGWSLPGLLFMAAASREHSIGAIAGASLLASAGVLAVVITGVVERVERAIPPPVAMAMLAGSTIDLCIRPFTAFGTEPVIVGSVIAGFLLARKAGRSWLPPAAGAVILGLPATALLGPDLHFAAPAALPPVHPVVPVASWPALASLTLPLAMFMLIGNAQGRAVLQANGFEPPSRPIGVTTGLMGAAHAFFGAPPACMQRVAMAVLSDEGAGEAARRWIAAAIGAAGCLLIALFAVPLAAFTGSLDPAFVDALAGMLLLKVLAEALKRVVDGASLAGPLAFCAAASDISLAGLSPEFWALAIGVAVSVVERDSA